MRPGDRLIVAFIEPHEVGEEFTTWFPHITIVPWFRTEISSEHIAGMLETELGKIKPFTVKIGAELSFGNRKRPANIIELPSAIVKVESKVRAYLKSHKAWLVDESTRRRSHYRPHITVQATGRAQPGESIKCDRLYIVSQQGNHKLIEEVIKL